MLHHQPLQIHNGPEAAMKKIDIAINIITEHNKFFISQIFKVIKIKN